MSRSVYILGVETSCDETAAAVVADGKVILSNVVVSSLKEHTKYGGIIPEIASRRQLEYIIPIIEEALSQADIKPTQLKCISVTSSPGLIGSLLVGLSFSRALSFALAKPLIEVDHIQAHLYANFLSHKNNIKIKSELPKLPAIGLVVSGGHTSLYLVKSFGQFELLGETRDDAVGEAFDKVARLLGLGYPGGPLIERLAQKGKMSRLEFSCAQLPGNFDFSFSGIKTAVMYYYKQHQNDPDLSIPHISYTFQESLIDVLVKKSLQACDQYKIKTLLVGGGVACNYSLRERLIKEGKRNRIHVFFPPLSLCTDNAAMIAGLGFHLVAK